MTRLLATTALAHLDHQLLVEVAPQAIRRRGDTLFGCLGTQGRDFIGVRRFAHIGVAIGEQDDTGEGSLLHALQNLRRPGLPSAVKIGRPTRTDVGQCGIECLPVADRLGWGKRFDAIVEDDQGCYIRGLQSIDDVFGATD